MDIFSLNELSILVVCRELTGGRKAGSDSLEGSMRLPSKAVAHGQFPKMAGSVFQPMGSSVKAVEQIAVKTVLRKVLAPLPWSGAPHSSLP